MVGAELLLSQGPCDCVYHGVELIVSMSAKPPPPTTTWHHLALHYFYATHTNPCLWVLVILRGLTLASNVPISEVLTSWFPLSSRPQGSPQTLPSTHKHQHPHVKSGPLPPSLERGGGGGGGVGTRPWWLALLACGGAYWPLAFEPSAMTSRHPYYCRWGGEGGGTNLCLYPK